MSKRPLYKELEQRIKALESETGRLKKALEESEEKFRVLTDSMPTPVLIYQDDKFIYANRAALEASGYCREEILNMNFWDFIHPDYRDLARERGQMRQRGEETVNTYDFKLLFQNGSERWAELWGGTTIIGGRPAGIISLIDVTERRQTEEALRESEKKYRMLTEKISDVVWTTDMTFRTFYTSPSVEKVLGFTPEERNSQSVDEVMTPESLSLVAEALAREMELEQQGLADPDRNITLDLEYYHKDGSTRLMENIISGIRDSEGVLTGIHGVSRDITAHKKALEALKESEELYTRLVNTIPDAVIRTDLEGKILFINDQALNMSGYSRSELTGKSIFDLVVPEDRDKLVLHAFIMLKERMGPQEYSIRTKDGGRIYFEVNGDVLRSGEGRPFGLVFACRDVSERRRNQEVLQESEAKFRILTDSSPTAVLLYQDGRFIYANRAAEAMTGYSTEEIAGMDLLDMIHPDYRESIGERVRKRMQGEAQTSRGEIKIITKDGGEKWADLTGASTMIGGRPAGIASVIDITERRRAEEALRESEQLYTTLINTMPDVVVRTDLEGRILFVNDQTLEISGHNRDEILGRNILQFIVPEDHEKVTKNLFLMMKGRLGPQEYSMVMKDGRKIPFEVNADVLRDRNGMPFGVVNMCRDIRERRRAQEMTRQSEEKFHKVFMTSPDCIAITRLQDGLILDVNMGFEEITGWRGEDAIGRTAYEINFWVDTAERNFMAGELRAGRDVLHRDFQFGTRSGAVREGVYSARSLTVSGESCLIFSMRDVTQRKQLEEDRRKLEERLKRAEKMEAVGQLAGGVAHDLNNVLGVLAGYSELLLVEMPEGKRPRGYVEKILQSTEKGAAIIQDLLTLARRGVTASEVVNLNSIVLGFLKTPVFEKIKDLHRNVNFAIECRDDLLNIKGSPVHLEKTLMNLVTNAAESISGSGEVTIRTQSRYLDMAVRGYDEVKEGDYTVLTITDTGMGIPAENRDKIFEPFYTKKAMGRSGTGLGLAIVWGTVKDHNGYIDVQSKIGEGTTFTLYFPATREEPAVPLQKVPIEGYMGKGESVLLVDDIAEQRDVASGLLRQLGYRVHAVASGEEAVEYLRENRADILILDMIMAPGMDGLETYKKVLEINPKQKAILVSGFSETDRVRQAHELGAGAYVKKPYLMERIGIAIRDELDRR